MARTCSVCASPHRRQIDEGLVEGASAARLARVHGLSERALRRHRASHLPAPSVEAREQAEGERGDDLLSRARQLERISVAILQRALAADDLRTALAAVGEAARLLQVQGRLLGQLAEAQPAPVLVTFNVPLPDETGLPPILEEDELPTMGEWGNGFR